MENHHSGSNTKKQSGHSDHWQDVKYKALAVGFFSRHVSDKSRRREILTRFMKRMKSRTQEDKTELCEKLAEYTISESPSNISTIRPRSPERSTRNIPYPDVPTYVKYEIPPNAKCALCMRVFPVFHEHEAVPCRICDDVFHKDCLMKCGDLTDTDKHNIDKARSNIGWSCPHCANISLLLPTDKVEEMTYLFERIDFNQDMQITLPEYLHHYSRRRSLTNRRGHLLPLEKDRLTRTFNYMDMNNDGKLDWWEFVNQESKHYLAEKNKHDLVDLLTRKELCAAKASFNSMDRDGDGRIKEYEVKDAFKKWFRQFEKHKPNFDTEVVKDSDILDLHANVFTQWIMEATDNQQDTEVVKDSDILDLHANVFTQWIMEATDNQQDTEVVKDSDILDLHANVFTQWIMEATDNQQEDVKWEDFILDQALYIVCARPNISI